ncbi:tRNA lysidine(34) synthetase TilS [Clostridia bacterium OttesenSCG-928-O13]|nr:tRNA lysidine(34) synthetase TilS [Clostridia bacterium OttesenSCG-928-O13]
MEFAENVFATLQKHSMLAPGECVIVAVSGGADSVALLHFMVQNREKLGITVLAAHFEHGLRGKESLADAAFVEEQCQQLGVQLFLEHGDMANRPKPQGLGTEAWARRLRYAFFERLAAQQGAKVALAHTQSDNAETVLFRAVRGTGPKGLSGIPPVRQVFIRPLLGLSRAEIEAYCRQNHLDYVTDGTNADNGYSRNRLRNVVMPQLEMVHPGAARNLALLAEDMAEMRVWLDVLARQLLADAGADREGLRESGGGAALYTALDGHSYSANVLRAAPRPVLRWALATMAPKSAGKVHLRQMEDVLWGRCPATQLPEGMLAKLDNDRFVVAAMPHPHTVPTPQNWAVPFSCGHIQLPGGFVVKVKKYENCDKTVFCQKSGQKDLTFAADCDKISIHGAFRTRRPKDRFRPPHRGVSKTLKKWMNEQKLPLHLRGCIPVLAVEHTVLWVFGAGFSDDVKADEQTRNWLTMQGYYSDDGGNGDG